MTSAMLARAAAQEPMGRRLWHRVPWLLLGLAGAFLAADVVGLFEAQLRERVVLAFFVPGVVYLADAVGTQTAALVIRGLSLGVPIGRVVGRELLTGLLVGLILAGAFFPVALWRWGQADLALAPAVRAPGRGAPAAGVRGPGAAGQPPANAGSRLGRRFGRARQKVAPPPGVSSTQMRPPCSSTIARAIASPRPLPGAGPPPEPPAR